MQVTVTTTPVDVTTLVGGPVLIQNLGAEDVWADVDIPTAATAVKIAADVALDWLPGGTGAYHLWLVTAADTADVRLLPLPG